MEAVVKIKMAKWWNARLPFGTVNIHPMKSKSVKSITAKTAQSQSEPLVLMPMSALDGLTEIASLAIVETALGVKGSL